MPRTIYKIKITLDQGELHGRLGLEVELGLGVALLGLEEKDQWKYLNFPRLFCLQIGFFEYTCVAEEEKGDPRRPRVRLEALDL